MNVKSSEEQEDTEQETGEQTPRQGSEVILGNCRNITEENLRQSKQLCPYCFTTIKSDYVES